MNHSPTDPSWPRQRMSAQPSCSKLHARRRSRLVCLSSSKARQPLPSQNPFRAHARYTICRLLSAATLRRGQLREARAPPHTLSKELLLVLPRQLTPPPPHRPPPALPP